MTTLEIKVVPNAKKELIKKENGMLKLYVGAPAVDGKANKAVIKFIAKFAGVSKSKVEIISGELSREKKIKIDADETKISDKIDAL